MEYLLEHEASDILRLKGGLRFPGENLLIGFENRDLIGSTVILEQFGDSASLAFRCLNDRAKS